MRAGRRPRIRLAARRRSARFALHAGALFCARTETSRMPRARNMLANNKGRRVRDMVTFILIPLSLVGYSLRRRRLHDIERAIDTHPGGERTFTAGCGRNHATSP